MVERKECCGTCEYGTYDKTNGYVCVNEKSKCYFVYPVICPKECRFYEKDTDSQCENTIQTTQNGQ